MNFSPETLVIDAEAEIERIVDSMRTQLRTKLRRRGLVLGLSGGIDSSVCAALAARAVGPDRVFALFMPRAPKGATRCAASPTKNIRPCRSRSSRR